MISINDFKLSKNELILIKKNIYKSLFVVIIIKILLYSVNKKNIKYLFREILLESISIFINNYLSYSLSKFFYNKLSVFYNNPIRKKLLNNIINIIISTIIKLLLYKLFYNKKIIFNQIIIIIFYITFYFMFIEPLFGNNKLSLFINKFIHDFIMFYNLDLFDDGIINKSNIELYFSIISSLLKIILDKIIMNHV
jgi:hypothetical protein